MSGLTTVLRILMVLAELYPEVEAWLTGLADGDSDCREQLKRVMGENPAAAELRRRGL